MSTLSSATQKLATPIITFLTDFGASDSYVAQMKGVILTACPTCQLIDITHQIPPQDVLSGSRILAEAALRFPPGTIHLAVVDPGVGTDRSIVAVQLAGHRFVLPDNGLLTHLLVQHEPDCAVQITKMNCATSPVSCTFHGRDIIAPAAVHLALGGKLSDMGPAAKRLYHCQLPIPVRLADDVGWQCPIVAADHYGNLALASCQELLSQLGQAQQVEIETACGVRQTAIVVDTYGQQAAGQLIMLIDSQGRLELAQVNGSAVKLLNVVSGQSLKIWLVPNL